MTVPAIKVEGLSKQYVVGQGERHDTFYDVLSHWLRGPLKNFGQKVEQEENFYALRNVSFEVRPGEVLGVIGRNGAGKSTLLKVLSRITAPTEGRIEIRGRLASLLEVGTGFHPELSGRENIFLNGAILGMTRQEILSKFDEIVAFAELEQFIDTPVKRYSSGMYVRLAFSVSAHLDVDVLVVDEVLAVGDATFQERCLRKMEDVSRGGRTVLFVSHNLGAVSRMCQRGIVLDKGRLVFDGTADLAIAEYTARLHLGDGLDKRSITGELIHRLAIDRISINGNNQAFGQVFFPDQEIVFTVSGTSVQLIHELRLTIALRKDGRHVLSLHDSKNPQNLPPGHFESTISLPAFHLSPGQYTVEVGAYSRRDRDWLWATHVASFSVASKWYPEYDTETEMGLINLPVWGNRVDSPTAVKRDRQLVLPASSSNE